MNIFKNLFSRGRPNEEQVRPHYHSAAPDSERLQERTACSVGAAPTAVPAFNVNPTFAWEDEDENAELAPSHQKLQKSMPWASLILLRFQPF